MKTRKYSQGFTHTELLVVIAVITMMGCLIWPALGRDQATGSRSFCRFRLGHLAKALAIYAPENSDWLPPNVDNGNTEPHHNWCGGQAGIGGAQEFNSDILRDPVRALLTPYLGGDISVYKCPEDRRMGIYQGTNTNLRGQNVPSVRTVSLNGAVGIDYTYTRGIMPVAGPWLDGNHSHTVNRTWYCFGKMSDFVKPGPASTYTFVEEDSISLNDGVFSFVGPMPQDNYAHQVYKMIDWPATYHDMAGGLAFADGHTEIHRWSDSRTRTKSPPTVETQPGNVDILWLAQRTSAKILY